MDKCLKMLNLWEPNSQFTVSAVQRPYVHILRSRSEWLHRAALFETEVLHSQVITFDRRSVFGDAPDAAPRMFLIGVGTGSVYIVDTYACSRPYLPA